MNELPTLSQLRLELGAAVQQKRRLYLDIKFWGILCDAVAPDRPDPDGIELVELLRSATRDGDLICPISFHVFVELTKQTLPQKLSQTAALIDELSGGVSLVSPPERVIVEARHFVQARLQGSTPAPAPLGEVWTKVAYFVGHGSLRSRRKPTENLDEVNRLFVQKLWTMSLGEMLEVMGDDRPPIFGWSKANTAKLNAHKGRARDQVKSFRQLYLNEIDGALETFREELGLTLRHAFAAAGGDSSRLSPSQVASARDTAVAILHHEFAHGDVADQLPTLHILAVLFACVDWDRHRKFKQNDLADFGHAAGALAYCDAFATDKSLASMLRQSKLTERFSCAALSDPRSVIEWIRRSPLAEH